MKKPAPVSTIDRAITCIAFAIIMITLTVLSNPSSKTVTAVTAAGQQTNNR